ncbi:hypothetical protein CGERO_08320 [Corynebacterium gerontici]|uniref:Uncharacterized protein n=1 Tax=Corynebacterium gerontici TaxID=2079234 RepID=A0A3G6J1W9_9CORY|nr:hypothetical protein CGERO_08320 [Corynebacterium gerontici]
MQSTAPKVIHIHFGHLPKLWISGRKFNFAILGFWLDSVVLVLREDVDAALVPLLLTPCAS